MTTGKQSANVTKAWEMFRKILDDRAKADKLTLELMQHKDFGTALTMDDLLKVNEVKMQTHEAMCQVVTALRKRWPSTMVSGMSYPWNKDEFNQYERATNETATTKEPNNVI